MATNHEAEKLNYAFARADAAFVVVAQAVDCAATTGYDLRSGYCRGERS